MRVKIILIVFLNLYGGLLFAQKPLKLFVGITGLNNQQKYFFSDNKISFAYIFYQSEITTANGDSLNEDLLTQKINQKIPDVHQSGLAVLDWENPTIFKESGDSDSYISITNEFIKAIKLAKKLRPDIKWGFYGLPLRTFKGRNQKWLDANYNLIPILKNADFLAPSLYLYNLKEYYKVDSQYTYKGAGDYLLENLNEALKLGNLLNKDVYPFIWHRINSGNQNKALGLVPLDIFRNYVQIILSHKFDAKGVGGIIWWDSQEYYYLNRKRYPVLLQEYKDIKNVNDYNFELLKKYYLAIAQFFE